MRHGRANIPQSGHSGFQFIFPCRVPFGRACAARDPARRLLVRSGSWGADKEKPPPVAEKPTDNISARSVNDSQGYANRGQVLAKSGKTEEALAEFDRALALDPYNVQALYGRALIYQGEKQHQQAIADFTAANGCRRKRSSRFRPCHQLPRDRQGQGSGGRPRRGRAVRPQQRAGVVSPWPGLRAARRQGQGGRPMVVRSRSVPRTKLPEAALPASAAKKLASSADGFRKTAYFGRTAWDTYFAADSTSSATAVCSRTDGSAHIGPQSSGREIGISAGGVGRRGSVYALAA